MSRKKVSINEKKNTEHDSTIILPGVSLSSSLSNLKINSKENSILTTSETYTNLKISESLRSRPFGVGNEVSESLELIVSQVRKLENELKELKEIKKSIPIEKNNSLLIKAYFKKWLKDKYIYRNELAPSTIIYENNILTDFNKELDNLNVTDKFNENEIKEFVLSVFTSTERIKSKSKNDDKNYYYKNLDIR